MVEAVEVEAGSMCHGPLLSPSPCQMVIRLLYQFLMMTVVVNSSLMVVVEVVASLMVMD
jgi:hypothetical protein